MRMRFVGVVATFLAIVFTLAFISSLVTTIQPIEGRVGVGLVRPQAPPPPPPPPLATGTVGGCYGCWGDEKGHIYVYKL